MRVSLEDCVGAFSHLLIDAGDLCGTTHSIAALPVLV